MHLDDLRTGRAQPGDRPPADGPLRLVQDFVNTVDRENGVELLERVAGLAGWLEARDLPGAGAVAAADVEHAVEVREALRALLLANNGHPSEVDAPEPAAARAVLDATAARTGLRPVFGGAAHPALTAPGDSADAALGRIVGIAVTAMLDGTWRRLKACPRDVCGWAFYDRSTANRATWCSMQVCGNRVKANAYYRRRTRG